MSDSDERVLLLLREARQQLESDRRRRNEPIAIVGIGCRLPGGANDPEAFWSLLEAGRDVLGEIPSDRWDNDALFDPDPDRPGKTYVNRGSFLDRIDGFEPEFFGISPREAAAMDPQQRLLLEVVWEAVEDAGIRPDALKGTATGVWVGMSADDYARRNVSLADPYTALGNARSIAVGRLSYFLDLHGPAVQVDTACSSSLVAVHQACQSLRSGECERAIAGGVNLMISPESTIALSKLRALAVDGRCKTFDAAADGYGRGEGCGIVVLERLTDALAKKRSIYAVIRGSAINHDGRSNGLTAPNGVAQEEVIRKALANASVTSDSVGYVETHGTGTLLGDPIEVLALNRVYGIERSAGHPLRLGALKTNVGHLEAAAGIAGLIKVALCLSHRRLVPSLNFTHPNPKIPWDSMSVEVVTEGGPWPAAAVRVGAVSSFGISGTNAHAVLEEAPAVELRAASAPRSAELILLSARTEPALKAAAGRLAQHLKTHPELTLGDLAYSLASRARMDRVLAVAAATPQALIQSLRAAADSNAVKLGSLSGVGSSRIAFVFAGQGSQWLGMGRQLLSEESVFLASMTECDRAVRGETGWSVLDELMASEADSRLDRIDVVQPVLFAVQCSLAELWQSWGVKPHTVIGHSMGEVAAACVAGALSLEDGASVVCRRSRLLKRISGQGQMALVELSMKEARLAIEGLDNRLSVAVSNSSRSTVVSGDPNALTLLLSKLEDRGVFCRRVKVDVASHSPQVDPLLDEIVLALRAIEPTLGHTAMLSTVTGQLVNGQDLTPDYWAQNLRQPVQFARALTALIEQGVHHFLEVGPHPVLVSAITEVLHDAGVDGTAVGSLRRDQPERLTLLESLGALVMAGHSERFDTTTCLTPPRHVRLPTYTWDRQRYWLDAPRGQDRSMSPGAVDRSPAAVADPTSKSVYQLEWRQLDLASAAVVCNERWVVVRRRNDRRAEEVAAALGARGATSEVLSIQELSGSLSTDHVVCDWDLPDGSADEAMRATLETLEIIQALARIPHAPRLWLATRSAMPVRPGDRICAAASAVWGLGRTAMHEHPEFRCVLLDLEQSAPLADVLAREATAPGDENQVAWRAGHRYVLRLARASEVVAPVAAPNSPSWSRSGSALVTGGFGGLGMAIARSLARSGVKHLVLTGRNVQRAEAAPLREELEALGAQLTVASADASDREAMARVIGAIPIECPLRMVVHLAGTFDDGLLIHQTPERVTKVLASKVAGAWNLHRLTEGMNLHAFLMFSSLAGVLGTTGEGSYSAANAYLDGLAAQRRVQGMRGLSIDWGPWEALGMVATLDEEQKARLSRHGVDMLAPASAVTLFEQLLGAEPEPSQLVIARFRLSEMSRGMAPWLRPIWLDVLGASRDAHDLRMVVPANDGPAVENGVPILAQTRKSVSDEALLAEVLAGLAPAERPSHLREWLARQSASILGYSDSSRINLRRGFFEMGMDSLMVLQLRRRLEGALDRKISATVTFAHPNIAALADHLLAESATPAPAAPPDKPGAALASQEPEQTFESEEDAMRFINSRFESDDE